MFIPSLQNFWPRLASKYGVKKYWQSSGEESAIVNAVSVQVNAKMCTSPILTCRLNVRFDCSTNSRHNQVPAKARLETYGLCLRRHPCRHIMSVLLTASEWCFMFLQVSAIDTCFREPVGRLQCSQIQGTMDEGKSSGPLGKAFFGT